MECVTKTSRGDLANEPADELADANVNWLMQTFEIVTGR
jgi:hypothetical protein